MLTGSSEEKDLPKDSVSQRRTLWGKMDPLDWVPERQPSWAPAGLSARLLLAASEPCGRRKVCSIWPCLWSTRTLFADGIASVSKALFALPHGNQIISETLLAHISRAIQMLQVLWTFLSHSQLCSLNLNPDIWKNCPWMCSPALSPQLCHPFIPWSLLLFQGNGNSPKCKPTLF